MIEIGDCKRYFELIRGILARYNIIDPKGCGQLFQVHSSPYGIEGWRIDHKRIKYLNESFIHINFEQGIYEKHKDSFEIIDLHYHFEPNGNEYLQLRFDIDKQEGIHANPDPQTGLQHRIFPEEIRLNFQKMNLYLMLKIIEHYIQSNNYPLYDSFADEYNEIVNKIGSEMENGR